VVADVLNEGGFEPATNYTALLTDINLLGRFNGWDVARAAREVDPNFPVVYMTGAAADEWAIQAFRTAFCFGSPLRPRKS
jgi:DNA-binding NtrC family response regulator